MILRDADYETLSKKIVSEGKCIIVYGAGMIGQMIIPYIITNYGLASNLECFIDADIRKTGEKIRICGKDYSIMTPDYLESIDENHIILITNSKFFSVVKFLDSIENLNNISGYIIPIMQICEMEKAESIEIKTKDETPLIPAKIHYCWFGRGEKPDFLKNCIASWKKYCPNYDIIEWNEDNYNINRHCYTKEAYAQKRYGFVSDLARLDILYENGGIYFDTDVSLVKNIDTLLFQKGFIGTEKWGNINSGGGCGFVKGHPMLKKMIDYRDQFHFVHSDGSLNIETNGMYETKAFMKEGYVPNNSLQDTAEVTIYPSCVNHPYDYMSGQTSITDSTMSIHHFYGGWMDENDKTHREKTRSEYNAILARMISR